MKQRNRIFYVFDNSGETIDRLTIVLNNGDVYTCSENATGIAMSSGNLVDNKLFITFGYAWRKYCNVRKLMRNEVQSYLNEARENSAWIGKEVTEFNSLTEGAQNYILSILR